MAIKTVKKPKKEKSASTDFKKLKLLVTIVNRNKTEFYMDFLSGFEVNFQTASLGRGTAKSETMRLLGLEESDKGVIFSVIKEEKTEEILRELDNKFNSIKKGKGVAFTVPLTSVIGVAIYRFLSNNRTV